MAKKTSRTTDPESKTAENADYKNIKSLTWSIRDVDIETRNLFTEVAKQRGKTIGQLMTTEVRTFLQGLITQTKLPATSQDKDNINSVANLIERLEKLERPLWKRLFS